MKPLFDSLSGPAKDALLGVAAMRYLFDTLHSLRRLLRPSTKVRLVDSHRLNREKRFGRQLLPKQRS